MTPISPMDCAIANRGYFETMFVGEVKGKPEINTLEPCQSQGTCMFTT
jgi:hypothetical protein